MILFLIDTTSSVELCKLHISFTRSLSFYPFYDVITFCKPWLSQWFSFILFFPAIGVCSQVGVLGMFYTQVMIWTLLFYLSLRPTLTTWDEHSQTFFIIHLSNSIFFSLHILSIVSIKPQHYLVTRSPRLFVHAITGKAEAAQSSLYSNLPECILYNNLFDMK